jgi:hypothetical protein
MMLHPLSTIVIYKHGASSVCTRIMSIQIRNISVSLGIPVLSLLYLLVLAYLNSTTDIVYDRHKKDLARRHKFEALSL